MRFPRFSRAIPEGLYSILRSPVFPYSPRFPRFLLHPLQPPTALYSLYTSNPFLQSANIPL